MRSRKKLLLLGGGHANIQVLQQLAQIDPSLVEVTLVSDVRYAPYSGMIPSYMAGVYRYEQLHFDLTEICRQRGYCLLEQEVVSIDAPLNRVRTADGQWIDYDICSVNLGIRPMPIAGERDEQGDVIYLKPISKFIEKWKKILETSAKSNQPVDFSVVGGGAAAFEIAVACRSRFPGLKHKVRIITGAHPLLYGQSLRTRSLAYRSLERLQVELIEGTRVVAIEREHLVLGNGRRMARQICLIGTSAQAPEIFRSSSLPTNAAGFVRVNADLRVEGYANLFAVGDCCHFSPEPLVKAGVFAVRQGPVLFRNLAKLIEGSDSLSDYKPQRHFLTIMVSGERRAIASYRGLAFDGWLAWKLKDLIDRRFHYRLSRIEEPRNLKWRRQ
jgi:selenide,water dikinase